MEINYIEDYYLVNDVLGELDMEEQLGGQLPGMNDENVIGPECVARKFYNIAENYY